MNNDSLSRFLIEGSNVRGEIVQLGDSWQEVLRRADYPLHVQRLLGEATAATALLAATIKFEGALTLQVRGDGPIELLVVQVTSDNTLRSMAKWNGHADTDSLLALIGNGQIVITVEQGEGKRDYQGVVPLQGEHLQDAIGAYFEQSEQLPTQLWLAADDSTAAGMLLQKLPGETQDKDLWGRVNQLAATIQAEELLELNDESILHRLFHEEAVRLFEAESLSFRCTCSRSKVESALLSLGREEVESVLQEQGDIRVECQFCKHEQVFDSVDVAELFKAEDGSQKDASH